MNKQLRHLSSGGLPAGRGWPLLLAVALAALWAAPAQAEDYGLKICGVQVTDANRADLSVIPGVQGGTVAYDPAARTLRLRNASIGTAHDISCIENIGVSSLTIEVEGRCAVTSGDWPCILMDSSTVIAGKSGAESPSLACIAGNTGIGVRAGALCTIRGLDLTATGQAYGIAGDGGGFLAIENATVRAAGAKRGSIDGFNSVALEGCHVLTPEGAAFDGGTLKKDGGVVTGEAVILPTSVGIGTAESDAPRRAASMSWTGRKW